MIESNFFNISIIPLEEAILRMFLSLVCGVLLGWDRERKGKTIHLQAYVIVSVTTCLMALVAQELALQFKDAGNVASLDLAKVIAGVLTGLGFLGAGALIKKDGDKVVGTATGASIWASGAIGVALGFGFYGLSLVAFIFIGGALFFGNKVHVESDKKS